MRSSFVTAELDSKAVVRGVLDSIDDEHITLHLPHTDYRIRLRLGVPREQITTPPGKRIKGTIEADALRIHPARGGGRFIEPIIGEPRIVAGMVISSSEADGRVLVNVAAPMWLRTKDGQDFDVIREGGLVNCHVQSGATFTPITD
jgi:hypothetical protein